MAKAKKDIDAADVASEAAALPTKIKMSRPHGFVDDETGVTRFWQINQIVFEPEDIALLIERGAHFEIVE